MALEILSWESVAKIKTQDAHPGEHGDGGEVSKESDSLAEEITKLSIENCQEENCEEGYAGSIAHDYLAMEIVQLRHGPIDKKDHTYGDKAKNTKDTEYDESWTCRKPFSGRLAFVPGAISSWNII